MPSSITDTLVNQRRLASVSPCSRHCRLRGGGYDPPSNKVDSCFTEDKKDDLKGRDKKDEAAMPVQP